MSQPLSLAALVRAQCAASQQRSILGKSFTGKFEVIGQVVKDKGKSEEISVLRGFSCERQTGKLQPMRDKIRTELPA